MYFGWFWEENSINPERNWDGSIENFIWNWIRAYMKMGKKHVSNQVTSVIKVNVERGTKQVVHLFLVLFLLFICTFTVYHFTSKSLGVTWTLPYTKASGACV